MSRRDRDRQGGVNLVVNNVHSTILCDAVICVAVPSPEGLLAVRVHALSGARSTALKATLSVQKAPDGEAPEGF
jgi:hypothetical protein